MLPAGRDRAQRQRRWRKDGAGHPPTKPQGWERPASHPTGSTAANGAGAPRAHVEGGRTIKCGRNGRKWRSAATAGMGRRQKERMEAGTAKHLLRLCRAVGLFRVAPRAIADPDTEFLR